MTRPLYTDAIHPPFGNYAHGMELPADGRWVVTSGQLGISKDGAIPESLSDQAWLCLHAIEAILREANMTTEHVVQLRTFVTDRAYFAQYMGIRDQWLGGRAVASTLLIVGGFTRPEFKIEVEATAISV